MKKASISLFAVVALVFAISSAFTTSKSTFTRDDGFYEYIGLTSGATLTWIDNLPNSYSFDLSEGASRDFSTVKETSVPGTCSTDDELVCAAEFQSNVPITIFGKEN